MGPLLPSAQPSLQGFPAWLTKPGSAYSRSVTQVPEYLLERSRARRAALGLGGDAPDTPAASAASEEPPASAPSDSAPVVATAEAPAPAPAAPPGPAAPAEPLPDYILDPGPKSGIPVWMMPVLLVLPLWGILYLGAFGETKQAELSPAELGAAVYQRSCQSCHGARGEGGVGPKVAEGEARLTFPNEADHIAWVESGSATKRGQPYGDANRPGGQRTASSGGMPAFAGQLSPAEISAVVLHEREAL